MDYMAVVSVGVYPTPTPTNTERAAYAVSYGLLDTFSEPVPGTTIIRILGSDLKKIIGG